MISVRNALTHVAFSLGPRSVVVRYALRRECRQHGVELSFGDGWIDVNRGRSTIRLAERLFPYVPDIAHLFDQYFNQVAPAVVDGKLMVDFSRPRVHRYNGSGLEFELASLAEEASASEDYFRWYRPKSGDLVFDMGAYCGVMTYRLAKMVEPTGQVIAFEPDPQNFPILQRNIARHKLSNVKAVQAAISGRSGNAEFRSEGALGSMLVEVHGRASAGDLARVRTITFAEACQEYGVPAFAKIDIEGAEVAMLAEAAEFLKTHPIHMVFDTNHRIEGEWTNGKVEALLRSIGYEVESSNAAGFLTTWARPLSVASK